MRFTLGLLLFWFSAVLAAEDSFVVQQEAPKPGEVTTEESVTTNAMTMNASVEGKVINSEESSQTESYRRRVTVLEVKDGVTTKAKVVYEAYECKGEPQPPPGPKPQLNTAYLVASQNGQVAIGDEAGGKLSAEEEAYLRKEWKDFGRPGGLESVMAGKTLKKGVPLDLSKDELSKALAMGEGKEVESFSVIYAGSKQEGDRRVALIDIAVKMTKAQGVMKTSLDLKGQVSLDATTGGLLRMELSGPMNVEGQVPKGETIIVLDGKGKTGMVRACTYHLEKP